MANCTVYNYGDKDSKDFDGNENDLTNVGRGPFGAQDWNDQIIKIVVQSGRWRFHEHVNAGGQHWDYGPGQHTDFPPNVISSIYVLEQ